MGQGGKSVRLSRRLLLGALLGSVAQRAFANPPQTSIRPPTRPSGSGQSSARGVEDLIAEADLGGKVGFMVADARTGEVLETRNPLLALPPASVTKVITALYALESLGPGHKFRTRLMATGPIRNGRLRGDLVLAGGGDPTLDTAALAGMARDLKATGLREISGKFLIYSNVLPSIFSIDPEQPEHVGYNPAISGLNLNYNRVRFEWKRAARGYDVTLDARAGKYSPQVAIARMSVVDRKVPVYTYADKGGVDQWTVARRALGKAGSRWLPVRKPELYAAEVFQTLARSHGIVLPRAVFAKSRPQGSVLVERVSPNLQDILRDMMRYSTNLTAEVAGLTAARADGNSARTLKASAAAMTVWAKAELGAGKARFVDHSGLGDRSRMAASDMVRALVKARREGSLGAMLKTIPMRNSDGEVVKDHPIKLRAKTGTLYFVSALAGYMTGPDGRDLAFAIFSADMARRSRIRKSDGDAPPGSKAWKTRSRRLQLQLIERWGASYGGLSR